MKIQVYIRPLVLEDAKTSCHWRNDADVWKYTGFKATTYITAEMETYWLQKNIDRTDQIRFAICAKGLDTYIGNVQLLNIENQSGELHLFIGNKLYWGKGIGYQATMLALRYGFLEQGLESIYLKVHPANIAALHLYEKAGFEITGEDNKLICMRVSQEKFMLANSEAICR